MATRTQQAAPRRQTILPEFVGNTVESLNCASRIVLKTCQGVERGVDGLDEIASLMLTQQKERLQLELTRDRASA